MKKIPDQILGLSPAPNDVPADWMTARDRFAIAAMQGILANSWMQTDALPRNVAKFAYQYADAMLATRVNSVDEG